MSEIITEKKYPIHRLWIIKSIFTYSRLLIIIILLYLLGSDRSKETSLLSFIVIVGIGMFALVTAILRRANFHYSIEEKFLIIKQGILLREQRYIPYGVIQNLFIKQDLFDQIFGLASLTIENASEGAGSVGFYGNKVSIPGLFKTDAEVLKGIILQKMKENPVMDSQSGL
jgi:uncharacterized membrane protein YdbT with pleckstrin-like domain